MQLDPRRGTSCRPTPEGLDCWLEGKERERLRLQALVVMDYDARSGTYRLVRSLGDDPRYRPESRIVVQRWTLKQKRLLLMH